MILFCMMNVGIPKAPGAMWGWLLAAWLGISFASSGLAAEGPRGNDWRERMLTNRPPNIVLIVADDLGYGDLGSYGQKRIKTPHLDRLAAEGMRFTQCYAGSTVCAPSRATLMTGQHTGHTRIRGNGNVPLAPADVTVAEVLQKAGYETGAIGKWGLGLEETTGTPHRQGFNEWFGYLSQKHAHDYYPTYLWRSSVANDQLENALVLDRNLDGAKGVYAPDLFTLAATNFVRNNRFKPFFLYLPLTFPHANNELGRETGNGMQVPNAQPYEKEDWPAPEKNKAAMITRLDQTVGAVLQELERIEVAHHTVVLFTSDNGPHREGGVDPEFFDSSGPLRGLKRDLYEGGIRVPLIVRWPGRVAAGSTNDLPVAYWDFMPTLAEIAEVNPPAGIDGLSFLPSLLGNEQTNRHDFFYWEFHEGGTQQAVRMNDWKAVRRAPGAPLELYDLSRDLGEKNDVAEKHPRVVARIENYLATARTKSEHWPVRSVAKQE